MMKLTIEDKAQIAEIKNRQTLSKQHRNHKLMIPQDKERRKTKMYLSFEDKKIMNEECTDKACLLHSYYVDLADTTQTELTDKFISSKTGWSVQVVQRHRLALEKANWFRKYTIVGGTKDKFSATYYLLDKTTILKDMPAEEFIALIEASVDDIDNSIVKEIIKQMREERKEA